MKVFVIEDNEQNLYLVRYLLESAGHLVMAAHDGLEAFTLLDSMLPDIILLDIQLPGIDGHQIAKQLRQNRTFDKTPIVAITSYAMNGDRLRALSVGCDAYLKKPIDPDSFVTAIEETAALGCHHSGGNK